MLSLYLTTQQLAGAVSQLEGTPLPVRTLAFWAEAGVVVPSVDWRRMKRSPRLYSLRDMARARLVLRLRRHGFSMARVRVVLAHLDAHGDSRELFRPKTRLVLRVDGWRVELHAPGQPGRSLPSGQLVLPLVDVVTGNDAAARAARTA